jgi:pimeloyl-ACP methyl ester carboxylesterase
MTDPEVPRLADGRRVHLWQGGAASGPTVFFHHGCPDTRLAARSGDRAARRAGVRLVAVSRPGYGRSDAAPSGHLSVADDTVAVADLLGVDDFAVLGMSVGGTYALACAARHPARVRAAAVVAAPAQVPDLDPPWPRDDLSEDQQAFFTRLARTPVEECVELMRPEFEGFVARVAPEDPDDEALASRWLDLLPALDAALVEGQSAADLAQAAREAVGRTAGYLRDAAVSFRAWDFRPHEVGCPTSLWYGELDPQVSLRNGRWLAEQLPGAALVVRPRTGHLGTLLDHWEELLSGLRAAGW